MLARSYTISRGMSTSTVQPSLRLQEDRKKRNAEWRARNPEYMREKYRTWRREVDAGIRKPRLRGPPMHYAVLANRPPAEIWHLRTRLREIKGGARARKLDFHLTDEDVLTLITSACTYCGETSSHGIGIDRVDSQLTYQANNVVPACWTCNRAKGNMSQHQFLSHVRKVFAHSLLAYAHVDDGAETDQDDLVTTPNEPIK